MHELLKMFLQETLLEGELAGGIATSNSNSMLGNSPSSDNMRFGTQKTGHTFGNILADEEHEQEKATQKQPLAACCLVVSHDGKVLAVSRKNNQTAFGLPGGKVDAGEEPIDAAARELREETGLVASELNLIYVRGDDEGFHKTYTYSCKVSGEIDTAEAGLVRWVHPQVLLKGPFGKYNAAMFAALGWSV